MTQEPIVPVPNDVQPKKKHFHWSLIILLAIAIIYWIAPDPFPGPVDDIIGIILAVAMGAPLDKLIEYWINQKRNRIEK